MMSVVKSKLSIPVPNIDLVSFLLDDIPEHGIQCIDPLFSRPYLFSAEDPESQNLSLIGFKHLVKCFASGLKRAGLQPGDHLMLVSPNYIHCLVICLGTIAAGGIFCTSQPDFKVREYTDQFRRDEPRWLLVADEDPLKSNALASWKTYGGTSDDVWFVNAIRDSGSRNGERSWTELLDFDGGLAFQWTRLESEEDCRRPCQMFYTSGTSGLRKAALLSHRNIVASFVGVRHRVMTEISTLMKAGKASELPKAATKILHTVSIARGTGTSLPLSIITSRKRRMVEVYFMSKTYVDMDPYLKITEKLGITTISCAPFTLIQMFAEHKLQSGVKYNFSNLSSITVTGAPSSQSTLNGARKFLLTNKAPSGIRIERALGITEAGSFVSHWHLSDPSNEIEGYQGRLEPNFEAKPVPYKNEDGHVVLLPEGAGEIWLRGPSCINVYYKNPDATLEAFSEGWLRTGDVGYFRDDKLFLLDRKKVRALSAPELYLT